MLNTNKSFTHCRRFYHVYKRIYTPSSQIAEQSIIHYKDGLLVLNKPYGISFSQDNNNFKDNDPTEVSLYTILPFLKKKYNCANLYNVRVPEKYISGVAIFSIDESLQKKIQKNLLRMRRERLPSDIYQAIVIGEPVTKISHFEGAIKLEKSPTSAKEKRVALVPSCSRNERKKGLAKNVVVAHRTLTNKDETSLVEVAATRNSWHCVRAYLSTTLLSPVLGDNLYGSCVKHILGEAILIDKFSPVSSLPQKVSPEILRKLNLTSVKDVSIPLHLHLSKVIIDHFDRDGTFDTFLAKPPESFTWTCEKLGLQTNFEND